jgi:DNA-binding transcriptional LysR family regulator
MRSSASLLKWIDITFIIHVMNLRRVDLNLLVIFDALMRERNVTRAADKVGLSQPAFSNALSRLRAFFEDDLFLRGPDGMRPTARALELADQVHEALAAIDAALDPVRFDPATAHRTFNIETNDYVVTAFFPALMQLLRKQAPGVDIRVSPQAGRAFERLDAQEIDLAISAFGDPPERFGVEDLSQDGYGVVMRRNHPLAEEKLTVARYAAASHVLVTPRGDPRGFVDEQLAEKGLTRRIALTVNQFASALPVVAGTDLIATLPLRIASIGAKRFGLMMKDAPILPPRGFQEVQMIWHKRLGAHPANVWLRGVLKRAAEI